MSMAQLVTTGPNLDVSLTFFTKPRSQATAFLSSILSKSQIARQERHKDLVDSVVAVFAVVSWAKIAARQKLLVFFKGQINLTNILPELLLSHLTSPSLGFF